MAPAEVFFLLSAVQHVDWPADEVQSPLRKERDGQSSSLPLCGAAPTALEKPAQLCVLTCALRSDRRIFFVPMTTMTSNMSMTPHVGADRAPFHAYHQSQ